MGQQQSQPADASKVAPVATSNDAPQTRSIASDDNPASNIERMFRRDTKTAWTEQQLLQYQHELQKEFERQKSLLQNGKTSGQETHSHDNHNDNNNNNNILSCCLNSKQKQKQKHREREKDEEEEEETESGMMKGHGGQHHTGMMNGGKVHIVSVPDIVEEDDVEMSIDDRLMKPTKMEHSIAQPANKNNHDLNVTMIDTTNAFLEFFELTQVQHLQEMRDRKMFLEKAKNDKDLPAEEREIAAWITNTYLSKSPTQNISAQTILKTFMKAKEPEKDDTDSNPENPTERQTQSDREQPLQSDATDDNNEEEKAKAEEGKIRKVARWELQEIVSMVSVDGALCGNDTVLSLLSCIEEWNFAVFEFVELCDHLSLSLLMLSICRSRSMLSTLQIPSEQLICYMNLVDINYKDNPYHNHIHAADVLLNMFYFMRASVFLDNISMLDCFSILVAAATHDIGHPGHGNTFEINTESELAIRYNDQSVLENMHICLAWNLLKAKPDSNFLVNLDKAQRKRFRKVLVDSILATDMSQHSIHSETLESLVEKYNSERGAWPKAEEAEILKFSNQFLPIALHTADLGNLCKEIKYYNEWVDRLMNEFFNQGDKERELGIEPISFLCDRFKVNIHSGQVGFINFVIRPWFVKLGKLMHEDTHNKLFLDLLNENLKYMQERANQTKDAQDEIKKNEHMLYIEDGDDAQHEHQHEHAHEHEQEQEHADEEADTVKPLPNTSMSRPIVLPLDDDSDNVHTERVSKSYSIVAMSVDAMRAKLKSYQDQESGKEKEKEKEKERESQ